MKISGYILFFTILQITGINYNAHAITPPQRAAINIWLQQQQNINPRPLKIIYILKSKTKNYKIKINQYSIDSNNVNIAAKTKLKSNIIKYKRILDTTFMFDEIIIKNTKRHNKNYHFDLILKKANIDKRGVYKNSEHKIFKSKTQVKYSIIKLIDKISAMGTLKYFCTSTPLKIKPGYVGARIKLIIFSYNMKFSGSFKNVTKVLGLISNNTNYISMHNLTLTANKKIYDFEVDLRFYQQDSRRNNLDKVFKFEKVKTDKICE